MSSKTTDSKASAINEAQAKTRVLLTLWDLGGNEKQVKRSELNKGIVRTNEKATGYQAVYEQLEKDGAVTLATKNRVVNVTLTEKGLQMLSEGLNNDDFAFDGNQVGTKVANALLKWIRQMGGAVAGTEEGVKTSVNGAQSAIESYDEFKQVVLDVYDKLNKNYNLDNLVPIYRIRREVGDRTSRESFNEWLLEMQAKDILQLQGGSLPDNDPAKLEDSITTEVSGLRCYAKRLNS
jgi:hypothetical protein